MTDAVCSTCFSRSGSRSIRAARTLCTVAGTADLFGGLAQAVRTPAPHQSACFLQRLDDLLDEEWIAARALANQLASKAAATDRCRAGRRRAPAIASGPSGSSGS